MWRKAFVRLLSFSFMSFFIAGLIFEESQRERKTTEDQSRRVSGKIEAPKAKSE